MAQKIVAGKPHLTKEMVFADLSRMFTAKYDLYWDKHHGYHFVIKKSIWAGVAVTVEQKEFDTWIYFDGVCASFLISFFIGRSIIQMGLKHLVWKPMVKEVEDTLNVLY